MALESIGKQLISNEAKIRAIHIGFEYENISLILLWNATQCITRAMAYLGKIYKIPVLTITHGIGGYVTKLCNYNSIEDKVVVFGKGDEEFFIKHFEYPEKTLTVTGSPFLDNWDVASEEDIVKIKNKLEINLHQKIILFAPTWYHSSLADNSFPEERRDLRLLLSAVERIYTENNIFLLIKLHPGKEHHLPMYEQELKDVNFPYKLFTDKALLPFLQIADVVVASCSLGVLVESLLVKKCTILYDINCPTPSMINYKYLDYFNVENAPFYIATNSQELLEMLNGALHGDNDFSEEDINNFVRRFNGPCDGHATERIAELAMNMVKEKISEDKLIRKKFIDIKTFNLIINHIIFLVNNRKIDQAISKLIKVIEKYPDAPDLINFKAEIFYQIGNLEEAKHELLYLINRWPENFKALNKLGVIYRKDGDCVKALEYFIKALKINPDDRVTLLNIGDILLNLKKYEELRKLYLAYIERNPDDSEITICLENLNKRILNEHGSTIARNRHPICSPAEPVTIDIGKSGLPVYADKSWIKMSFIDRCIKWIKNNTIPGEGIVVTSRNRISYAEVTGYFIPTLLLIGEKELARQYGGWLTTIQRKNGSFGLGNDELSYAFDTGQVVRGWISLIEQLPFLEEPLRRACNWLINTADYKTGRLLVPPHESAWSLGPHGKINEGIHLYVLVPLLRAGEVLREAGYIKFVKKSLNYYLSHVNLTDFTLSNSLTHFYAYIQEALLDLGCDKEVAQGMASVARFQQESGAVPAYSDVNWICSTGLAQLAMVWYRLKEFNRAEGAMNFLKMIQNPSGGFFGSYGVGADYFPAEEISWAVKYGIEAYQLQISSHFNQTVNIYNPNISKLDGRAQVLLHNLGNLNGKRLLDAGCGKGRYCKLIKEFYPDADVTGLDISEEMLSHLPSYIRKVKNGILDMPFSDGEFDAVICIEALEHVIQIKEGVEELSRVLSPGGKLIIIDKNKDKLANFNIPDWEKWFDREELIKFMKDNGFDVTSEFVGYDDVKEPDGLFICWTGNKKRV
ncbi:MAG: methyltransferase domain-containing protein [Candidatus Eremiobacterota bacterium]